MQISGAPAQLVLPWANAGSKNNPIPVPSQIGVTPGAASWTDGFPPLCDTPIANGGVPPSMQDTNGGLYQMSAVDVWLCAGGSFPYSSSFSSAVGGYPRGARVLMATGNGFWLSTVDNNTTDPDTGGAGWVPTKDSAVAALVYQATSQNLPGPGYVFFDTVVSDQFSLWNQADYAFVAAWPGLYRVSGAVSFASAAAGVYVSSILIDGSATHVNYAPPQVSNGNYTVPFSAIEQVTAGQKITVGMDVPNSAVPSMAGSSHTYAQVEYLGLP